MLKFQSLSRSLEIAEVWDRSLPCYLNRPLIGILGDLGIKADAFLKIQADAVEKVSLARSSFDDGANLLDRVGLGGTSKLSSTLRGLSRLLPESSASIDPFLESCIDAAVVDSLKQLKFRSRYQVDGFTMVGVADEGAILLSSFSYFPP
jgi:hypothetical protein